MKSIKIISHVEAQQCLDSIKHCSEIYLMARISYETGARLNELVKLTKERISKNHIQLGRLLYKGTGRQILLKDDTNQLLQQFIKNKKRADRIFNVSLCELNNCINEMRKATNIEGITFRSFRQSFICRLYEKSDHNLLETTFEERELFLDLIGFDASKHKKIDFVNFEQFKRVVKNNEK